MEQESDLNSIMRQVWAGLAALIGFGFLSNFLMLAVPMYMIQVFDRVLNSGSYETLLFLTIIVVITLLIMGVIEAVRKRIQDRTSSWLEVKMSPTLLENSMGAALSGYPANAQSLRDLGSIRQFISGALRPLTDILWVPLFIIAISLLHIYLGLFAIAAGLVLLAIAWLNDILTRDPLKEASQSHVKNLHLADLATRNADVIHAMGLFTHFKESWQKRNGEVLAQRATAGDSSGALYGLSRFLRMAAQVGVLGMGAYLVLGNSLTPGGMIAGSILLGRALGPLEQAITSWRGFLSARSAYERIEALDNFVGQETKQRDLPAPQGKLSCEKVTYYPKGQPKPALQQVSFALQRGDVLGVLGPSSAGKTTLCKIIVGTWKPNDGHARLDGADVYSWDSEELGPHVGYLPQNVELFATTIKENIARLDPNPDPKRVQEAAMLADVHELVLRLPDGYDTVLGEGQLQLSGGQRQRIGLARALYGRPKLLVLDEPNSNLDTDGEQALVKAISRAQSWNATIIMVTHQVRLLRPVNKVLVLQEGKVKLFGGRDEVLERLKFKQVQIFETKEEAGEKEDKNDTAEKKTISDITKGLETGKKEKKGKN